jgi:hypothetical protein
MFGLLLHQRPGNLESHVPFLCLGAAQPVDHEQIGLGWELRGDPTQFFVGFEVIAQFRPALGCFQVKTVGRSRLRIEPPSHLERATVL